MGIGFLFFNPLIMPSTRNQASALNTEVGVFKGPALSRTLLSGVYTTEDCCMSFPQLRGVQVVGDVGFFDKACLDRFYCNSCTDFIFCSVFRNLLS